MKVESKGIVIHLEQDEIMDFWNIVMFAIDLHDERTKNGESCMTKGELDLAKKIVDTLDNIKWGN